ncbi:MAG: polyphenol oxidase family protein, partial [Chthoniobacterales bacterium]
DCAAVYLADKKGRAIGLVHSGRAGTEMNIVTRAIEAMEENFGVARQDMVAEISPCIRPPLYETDFAATIREQAAAAGVAEIRDAGICTGRDTANYYSYRMERGQTGRMLAVLALRS